MDAVDEALCRSWALSLEDDLNDVEKELGHLLPLLIEAGFVKTSGHSPSGYFWAYTENGIWRLEELGCD